VIAPCLSFPLSYGVLIQNVSNKRVMDDFLENLTQICNFLGLLY